jgi:hypothetical protein
MAADLAGIGSGIAFTAEAASLTRSGAGSHPHEEQVIWAWGR